MNKKQIAIIASFFGVLILRDMPYFNVFISNRTPIMYIFICVVSVFLFIHVTIRFLVFLSMLFLAILLVSSLFFEGLYSEIFGVIVYLLLFLIAIGKIISLIKSLRS